MNMKSIMKAAVVAAIALSAATANASVVTFDGGPSGSFADGTFSTNLSGIWPDGFFATSTTQAYNGFGQTGEWISFNSAKQLNFLTLDEYYALEGVTVSLYDSLGNLVAAQTADFVNGPSSQTLTFDANNVSKVVFDNIGGVNYYGDGRSAAWYFVDNITYSDNVGGGNAVPEPATLAMFGLGALALTASRRRSRQK
jgi:hypothetical protein